MKKTLAALLTILLLSGALFSNIKVAHASDLQIEQGYLSTGSGKGGQAAYYSSRKQGDRGFTTADLRTFGGATIWVQVSTIDTRKTKTGTYNNSHQVEVWQYGQSFSHHYYGVWPAY